LVDGIKRLVVDKLFVRSVVSVVAAVLFVLLRDEFGSIIFNIELDPAQFDYVTPIELVVQIVLS